MAKILGAQIPFDIKNLAINGALDFWQRVESSTTTVSASGGGGYTADMFQYEAGGSTTKNFTIVQSSTVPTQTQSGFESPFSALFTMTTGIASPAASDFLTPFAYRMEGLDYARIHQKTITISFWFIASIAGTYSLALRNSGATRCYVTTFNQANANAWQFQSVTITLDSAGTWLFNNGIGLEVDIASYGGSNFTTSTLNQWQTGNFFIASTATNYQATSGATFNFAQFSIVEGALGLGATGFMRNGRDIAQELVACQRYYEKSYDIGIAPGTSNANGAGIGQGFVGGGFIPTGANVLFKVTKRTTSYSGIFYNPNSGAANAIYDASTGGSIGVSASNQGVNGMYPGASFSNGHTYEWAWAADAGL